MPLILVLLFLFVTCGWVLPAWAWGVVPIVLGAVMLLGGLLGIVGSFKSPGATTGLGSVLIAFFGVVLIVFGLGMAGRGDIADACLSWLKSVDDSSLFIGSMIVGVVLAAFANRRQ